MTRTILITGCSDGGLGAALAVAFHNHGDRVFATTRNPAKMASLSALGIETLALDVLSEDSIKDCVNEVSALTGGSLDMLVNNAGAGYSKPLLDASIPEMQKVFDLNVWSIVRMVRLFFPLLRNAKEGGHVVNNTSIAGTIGMPFQGGYASSKAAASMLTHVLLYELQPFGIKVTDLKSGGVKSNIFTNSPAVLPESSVYLPGKEKIEAVMNGDMGVEFMDRARWAQAVVKDLSKHHAPQQVYRGAGATMMWFVANFLPAFAVKYMLFKTAGLDVLEQRLKAESTKDK